jgi:hypothetical protein
VVGELTALPHRLMSTCAKRRGSPCSRRARKFDAHPSPASTSVSCPRSYEPPCSRGVEPEVAGQA